MKTLQTILLCGLDRATGIEDGWEARLLQTQTRMSSLQISTPACLVSIGTKFTQMKTLNKSPCLDFRLLEVIKFIQLESESNPSSRGVLEWIVVDFCAYSCVSSRYSKYSDDVHYDCDRYKHAVSRQCFFCNPGTLATIQWHLIKKISIMTITKSICCWHARWDNGYGQEEDRLMCGVMGENGSHRQWGKRKP